MRVKTMWSLLVSLVFLCSATNLAAKSEVTDGGSYTTKDSEFYLTPEHLLFIRPGLVMEITDVVVPADRQAEVTFTLSDPAGLPLDRTGVYTPGPVSTSFIIANIPAGEEGYYAYTNRIQTSPITGDSAEQGTSDSGGTYTEMAIGTYMYKFGTVLPEGYDMDVTHTVGIYARRDLTEFDLDRYVDNETYHFVPSGSAMPMPREIVTTETCNGRCHDPLAIHGGARTDVDLCILCHNPNQDIDPDTGNSFDMPLMVHKIHMGAELANGYNIIGYRQSNHDYSDVVYPASITECESCHTGGTPTESFPLVASPNPVPVCDGSGVGATLLEWGDLDSFEIHMNTADGPLFAASAGEGSAMTGKWVADGSTFVLVDKASGDALQTLTVNATGFGCVGNPPGAAVGVAATNHTNWMDNPGRKSCGACHDSINWATGEGHASGIPQENDNSCGNCHRPTGSEFGRSVQGSHTQLYKSVEMPNVIVEFLDISNTGPGENPVVTFSLKGKNGPIHPGSMNRMLFVITGPNEDWAYDYFYVDEDARSAVQDGDNWVYTFETPLPDDAAGSFTISMEGRIEVEVDMGDGPDTERDYAENPMMAFAVTGDSATPRRKVVDDAKCEACHLNLSLHGNNRHDVTYCSTCHTPDRLDIADVPESVHMKWMIHKIHRGAELENGYVVIRSRGTYDFSNIHFTGDLRNCDACHVNGTQNLPVASGALPTITNNAWWTPMEPQAAACLSCHDDDDSAAHAYANTTFFGESCSTCHGEGKSAAVDKVHAR
ncbi:MAG: hypothetical protein WBN41_07535 [Lysobacterales bacterium]